MCQHTENMHIYVCHASHILILRVKKTFYQIMSPILPHIQTIPWVCGLGNFEITFCFLRHQGTICCPKGIIYKMDPGKPVGVRICLDRREFWFNVFRFKKIFKSVSKMHCII